AIKILFTARPTYDRHRKVHNLNDNCNKITLEAFDMVDAIIEKYVEKSEKPKPSTEEKEMIINDSQNSLWVLAYSLKAWEPGNPIQKNQVYEKVYDDLMGLDNKYSIKGSHDVILALAPFYSYEIRVKRVFLSKQLKLDDRTITKLLDVGEIKESKESGFLSLDHSAIAEIYLKTGEMYRELIDSLLEDLKKFNKNFRNNKDFKVNMFRYYLSEYEGENYDEIFSHLSYEEGLIGDILNDVDTCIAVYHLVKDEPDIKKIWRCIDAISFARSDMAKKLFDPLLICLVWKLKEYDIEKIGEFIGDFSFQNKKVATELGERLLYDILVPKIEQEWDEVRLSRFAMDIVERNEDLGRIFEAGFREEGYHRGILPLLVTSGYFTEELKGKYRGGCFDLLRQKTKKHT
ncbi:MAG: hypothetical protein OIN88_12260, partial [Candidatus Methanoperedens sp.]|nr:hypothetical protein [Candidatus Methanoperedens sp.]